MTEILCIYSGKQARLLHAGTLRKIEVFVPKIHHTTLKAPILGVVVLFAAVESASLCELEGQYLRNYRP